MKNIFSNSLSPKTQFAPLLRELELLEGNLLKSKLGPYSTEEGGWCCTAKLGHFVVFRLRKHLLSEAR